jgi:GNAT superfamily N-acetyltransferase
LARGNLDGSRDADVVTALHVQPSTDQSVRATLPGGQVVTIRPVETTDEDEVREAFRTADPFDLHRRFMGCAPPIETVLRYLNRADGLHVLALGAFSTEGRLVGLAQFDRPGDGPTAEFALEVAHDFQRKGLGGQLLADLEQRARCVGVHQLTATYYADNFPIRRLLGHTGQLQSTSYDCGEGVACLNLDNLGCGTRQMPAVPASSGS